MGVGMGMGMGVGVGMRMRMRMGMGMGVGMGVDLASMSNCMLHSNFGQLMRLRTSPPGPLLTSLNTRVLQLYQLGAPPKNGQGVGEGGGYGVYAESLDTAVP